MEYDYLSINFAACIGILFLLIFLWQDKILEKQVKRIFYLLLAFETMEMIVYSMELGISSQSTFTPMRILLSAIGYMIRPFLIYLLLMQTLRYKENNKMKLWLLIPAIINTLIAFSAFFTDIAYSYTKDNQFVRGPLGYTTHIILAFYLLCILFFLLNDKKRREKFETVVIFAIMCLVMGSVIIEAVYKNREIGRTAIVLATVFYYMFFQTQVYSTSMEKERGMRKAFEQESQKDGLTGLLNKKSFLIQTKNILERQKLETRAFVFVDLDHFKEVNDRFGHAVGDEVIKEAGKTICEVFRKNDLMGRFGGDEFCIMLVDINRVNLQILIKRLVQALEKDWIHNEKSLHLTASIGVFFCEENKVIEADEMVRLADEALYEAKEHGRNRYVIKEYQ